jgi:hypothetical protein
MLATSGRRRRRLPDSRSADAGDLATTGNSGAGSGGGSMVDIIDKTRRVLWALIEIAFLLLLALILTHLILGENAGGYVQSVVDNVMKFASGIPTQSLVGLAVVGLLIYVIAQRLKA